MLQDNYIPAGTPLQEVHVQGSEQVVDTVEVGEAAACLWRYVLEREENRQMGSFRAVWTSDGMTIVTDWESTEDVGDCSDVSLSVARNGSRIELRASTTLPWTVKYRRSLFG